MARRKTIYTIKHSKSTKPGVSPNAYKDEVTAEIRVHFPPYPENLADARRMLAEAYDEVLATLVDAQIAHRREDAQNGS